MPVSGPPSIFLHYTMMRPLHHAGSRCRLVAVVVEDGGEPLLHLGHVHALACCVLLHLIPADLPHSKVLGVGVGEDEGGDGGGGHHGERLGEPDARELLHLEQVPHGALLSVVRLAGVPRRGADALVADLVQVLGGQLLVGRVPPEGGADVPVQLLSEGLHQPVGQGLHHDLVVVVVRGLVPGGLLVCAQAGHGEGAQVVPHRAALPAGGHKVRQRQVGLVRLLLGLLPQHAELPQGRLPPLGGEHLHVLAVLGACRGEDGVHARQPQLLVVHNVPEHGLRVVEELARLGAHGLVVEDLGVPAVGVPAAQLPGLEEGVPVDEGHHVRELVALQGLHARGAGRGHGRPRGKVHLQPLGPDLGEVQVDALLQGGVVLLAQLLVLLQQLLHVGLLLGGREQALHHGY
mmetsp:Transcript_122572/g.280950  ORF Transcript_122572/g.280950 Transcript_122572/m.280950 type:complete len:404 (-) Transcript_122572:565-1776(-)